MTLTIDSKEVEELFHAVVDLAPDEAARVLDAQPAPHVRQVVERLLRHDRAVPPNFLLPNAALAAEVVGAAERTGERELPADEGLREAEKVGRFIVLKRLGAGAMGVVYTAYDESLDRRVALKLLRRGLALPEQLAREARALARLTHPNVVQIYEVGEHHGRPFIAMELVAGSSLSAWLAERPRRPAQILRIFIQAGHGISAAHDAGLVHRDIKPDNILVGSDGRVRVVDFGVAALSESPGECQRAMLPGTPGFMAPELFLGERATPASDQFAFCVAVYRALFGCAPFAGEDIPTLRRNVLAGTLSAPPQRSELPPWVSRIVVRGLAREPGDRFPDMRSLLQELERRLPVNPELDPTMGRSERRVLALSMSLSGVVVLALISWVHVRQHLVLTNLHFVEIPLGALGIQALIVVALPRQLLGNRFARKEMLVVWISIFTILLHRILGLHFQQSVPQVLCVDMLILGMQHAIAAAVFERWFWFSALVFLAGATLAFAVPTWAPPAMLVSVILAYALAAGRIGV